MTDRVHRRYRFPKPYSRCVRCGLRRGRRRTTCTACDGRVFVLGHDGDKDDLNAPMGQLVRRALETEGATPAEAWGFMVIQCELRKLRRRLSEEVAPYQMTDFALSGFGSWPLKAKRCADNACFWG